MNLQFVNLIYAFNSDLLKVVQSDRLRVLGAKELEYAKICITEEMDELHKSLDVSDMKRCVVEQVDALVDSLYFSVGHLYRMGWLESAVTSDIEICLKDNGIFEMESHGSLIEPLADNMIQAIRGRCILNVEKLRGQSVSNDTDVVYSTIMASIEGMLAMGLSLVQIAKVIEIVDTQNKKKKKGVNARRDVGVEDAVKPEDWVPPEDLIFEYLFGGK